MKAHSMQCAKKNRNELIEDYLAGGLSNKEKEAFEEHFFNCNTCFQELRLRQEVVDLIKDEGKVLFESYLTQETQDTVTFKPQNRWLQWPRLAGSARWVYVTLVLLVVGGGSYLMVDHLTKDDLLQQYVYDDKVPHAFVPSEETRLRSAFDTLEDASVLASFYDDFLAGMLEDKDRNYIDSIEILNSLRATADDLERKVTDKEILTLIRDYHFYLGVSHLAISRSEQIDIDEKTKRLHLEDAIQELSGSTTLAMNNSLDSIDRDRFFGGLAYGLAGQKDIAVEKLIKTNSESPFFEYSDELIGKWSN